jgi:hypothetical protein
MRAVASAVLLILLAGQASIPAQGAPRAAVTLKADRLSVNAREAPLRQILAELSRLSGIQVYLETTLERQIAREATTVVFESLTIEEGLRRLLRAKNFILVYSPSGLAEVRVYGEGRGEFRRLAVETKRPPARARTVQKTDRPPAGAAGELAQLIRLRGEALGNPDPAERSGALDELGGSGDQKLVLETALEVLERERDPEVLKSALDLLADQESVPLEPLLRLAASRESALRIQALELLSEHGKQDPRVSELLKTVAGNDRDEEVRESAKSLLDELDAE